MDNKTNYTSLTVSKAQKDSAVKVGVYSTAEVNVRIDTNPGISSHTAIKFPSINRKSYYLDKTELLSYFPSAPHHGTIR